MPPKAKSTPAPVAETIAILRQHAEDQFAQKLAELSHTDIRQRPPNWNLSPWAVATYLMLIPTCKTSDLP